MDDPAAQPAKSRAGRDLPAAIAVGGGLFAAIAVTLLWWNWGFVLLAAAALSLGTVEVHRALQRVGMNAAIVPIVIGTIAIIVGSYLATQIEHSRIASNSFLLVSIGLTVLVSLGWRMPKGPEGFVRDAAASLFIIGYVPLLGAFVSLLIAPADGPARIITFILCVMGSDIGGYAVGVLFGKHPMAPVVSPKKTWEGFAGSVFFGVLVGVVAVHFLLGAPWWIGIVLGAALVAAATLGDLIESLIKRDVGIKDMSSFLPGHGGIMDRLDSLLVAAPVAWLVLYYLVPSA
ncbi:MAG: phosphatidate cytidylyltransferase [Propionibacteriaceae bacterium]|nr:phosphatidate cytidylyltransferase [Propionibacteriaceae bacterium]